MDAVTTRGKQHTHSSFKKIPEFNTVNYLHVIAKSEFLIDVVCNID
jgi:hypothetical protein